MILKRKRGQEEMIGFILIILLVVVIFLVILGISIRSEGEGKLIESREVSQFIQSAMRFNTDCAVSIKSDLYEVRRLALECYSNPQRKCLSGENVCDVVNRTVSELVEESWPIGPDRVYKGYTFEANFTGGTREESIIQIEKGDCLNKDIRGGEFLSFELTTTLGLCV